LNCWWVIFVIISTVRHHRWQCMSPWRRLEETKHGSLAWPKPLLFLQHLLKARKHPHNFLSTCCCSLLIWINFSDALKPASSSLSPSVNFISMVVPFLGSGWVFWVSSRVLFFQIWQYCHAWAPAMEG